MIEFFSSLSLWVKGLLTFLTGAGAVGIFSAWIGYKGNKPKNEAEAKQIEANTVVTVVDGWERLYNKIEKSSADTDSKLAAMTILYTNLQETCRKNEEAHRLIVLEKDGIISRQAGEIKSLQDRVGKLESRLSKYEGLDDKVEEAKAELHKSVDDVTDHLKQQQNESRE